MKEVFREPSRLYMAGSHVFEFDVPPFREITVRLSREGWPPGDCGDARLVSPQGKAGRFGFAGGAYIPKGETEPMRETHAGFRLQHDPRDGTPAVVLEQPGGHYSLTLNLLQDLRTAVIVEVI